MEAEILEDIYPDGPSGTGQAAIKAGQSLVGKTKYVFGGGRKQSDINNGIFDCSSFVHWAFKQGGLDLGNVANTSTETLNKIGTKVSYSDIRVGDVVFFDTYKKDGHVGIYVGNGKFIGAQKSTGVAIADMSSGYWKDKFSGHVRRFPGGSGAVSRADLGQAGDSRSVGDLNTTLKQGSKGELVKEVQRAVGVKVDGVYGPDTVKAVKAYQKKNGLTADGIVGAKTWEKINGNASYASGSIGYAANSATSGNGKSTSSGGNNPYKVTASSYKNTWKTKKEAANSSNYKTYKTHLAQAMQSGKIPGSWVVALTELIGRESTWNPKGDNPKSTAWGYGQFLDSTRANYKKKYPQYDYNNPVHQIILTALYVKDRYGTPEAALKFWDKNNFY